MASKRFAGFTALSSSGNLYLYTPAKSADTSSTTTAYTAGSPSPDLVVLCSWMGAAPKHILKYTAAYQSAYPAATILVVTNEITDVIVRPHWLQRRRVGPAIDFVHDFSQARPGARILLHGFSNGGGLQLVQLGTAYRRKYAAGIPAGALALDSMPGTGRDFREGLTAIAAAFPPALRPVAYPVTFVMMVMFWLVTNVFRMKNIIDFLRDALVDELVLGKDVPRVYLYGKGDKLIQWREVESHVDQAEAAGFWTEKVEFQGSGHVQHMMADPKRYWGAVTDVMNEAESRR